MIEIRFLIFGPKIVSGLIFTQNSYIIIPDWFVWPLGKELDFSLFLKFLSISWSVASASLSSIITNDHHHHLNSRDPKQSPSGCSAIINTSLSRGWLRVSVCGRIINPLSLNGRIINPISPGLSCGTDPGWHGPVSLNDPGLHPRNYRAPGTGSTLASAIAVSPRGQLSHQSSQFIQKGEKSICHEGENQPNGSQNPRFERLSNCQFSKE